MRKLKQSSKQYRNIKGKSYEMWTADSGLFDEEKKLAKEKGLSTRIIDGQLYRQKSK